MSSAGSTGHVAHGFRKVDSLFLNLQKRLSEITSHIGAHSKKAPTRDKGEESEEVGENLGSGSVDASIVEHTQDGKHSSVSAGKQPHQIRDVKTKKNKKSRSEPFVRRFGRLATTDQVLSGVKLSGKTALITGKLMHWLFCKMSRVSTDL
jgi:hypothetical protein